MKAKEIYSLKKGDKINHKHYGICEVQNIIPEFGPVIKPIEKEGKKLLKSQSDTVEMFQNYPVGTPLLETSFRLITGYI